jgi:quercetin dioxygenase-like cupin family protein
MEIPMGQITTWDEFPTVEYVPGVFRQAVSGEKTMLTRIVYRGGVVIPDHSHEAEQLMLVEQGRLWAKVGDEESEVGPGSLLIIPSNYVHAFRQLTDEDVVFYECFAPIRLEYLVGFKGPDASLAMMKKALAVETDRMEVDAEQHGMPRRQKPTRSART